MKKTFLIITSLVLASVPSFGQLSLNPTPSRVLGHPKILLPLSTGEPNLIEGREFQSPQGIAVDTSGGSFGPLYVADTINNRVLAWRNSASFVNGAKADAVIGQSDMYSTYARSGSGLVAPTGLAVDNQGNLYVADSGNNRIVRYSKPLSQPGDTKLVDLVLGQTSLSNTSANAGGISASTLASYAVANGQTLLFNMGLTFDSAGNLWASDPLNNRVLRYPAANLKSTTYGPAADIVLGQPDFKTNSIPTLPAGTDIRASKDIVYQPGGLAFDQAGRLFVADGLARVLAFMPGNFMGQKTARIIGVKPNDKTIPMPITNASVGSIPDAQHINGPGGAFTIGNAVFVVDTPNHRILEYDSFDNWPAESTQFSPLAKNVYGQATFAGSKANRGNAEPDAGTLSNPTAAFAIQGNVYLADSGNNRVLIFRGGNLTSASGVLGQDDFPYRQPNLIEGREFYFFAGFNAYNGVNAVIAEGVGIAVDIKASQPALWVADPYNHRVLGFRDVRKVRAGDKADIVIGQMFSQQFSRALINYPGNDPNTRNDTGLFVPVAVAVDPFGDVWVADTGNARVLRFPKPWANVNGNQQANLVIGQPDFTAKLSSDPTVGNLAHPVGLAFTSAGHLLVSDSQHHRVLFYERPSGGDFSNGQPASKVFGQSDFNSATAVVNNPASGMAFPHGIAIDVDDRLYVADTGNNRVQVFDLVTIQPAKGAFPAFMLTGVSSPHGVAVSSVAGEIWVADTRNQRVARYPSYFNLVTGNTAIEASVPANYPLGLTIDAFGNVVVAESVNRVSLYFPAISAANAASYNGRFPLSPGQIASLFPKGTGFSFGNVTSSFTDLQTPVPLPTTLADISVTIGGKPVPLYFVSPGQINFMVPMSNPDNGTGDMEVIRPSTQQILAASTMQFGPAMPALFTSNASGSGQIAALNQDNSVNSSSNPEARGRVVQMFGTGQGFVPNAPPDGAPASGITSTPISPVVIMGGQQVPTSNVLYSGLAPGLIGVWQINVLIPQYVVPGTIQVAVVMRSIPSTGGPDPNKPLVTTIAVKQSQ